MQFEKLIIEKGFKPTTFYKFVGLDRQVVYNYRKGVATPSCKSLLKIAQAMQTSVDEVLACFK